MNFIKNSKGITLIALVITIIVLLILAGVSLSLIMGNDGILGRAENATVKHNIASVEEDIQLAIADLTMAYYDNEDVNVNAGEGLNEYVTRKLNGHITQNGAIIQIAEGEGEVELTYRSSGKITTGKFNTATSGVTISGVTSGGSGNSVGNGGTPTPEPEPEPTKYTVTYNANGGTGVPTDSSQYAEGATVTVNFTTLPTKEGFTFLGWATTADATTANYTSIGTTSFAMGTANITLYAVWEEETDPTAGATANTRNRVLSGTTNVSEMTYKNPVIPQGFNAVSTAEAEWEYTDETKTEVKGWNNGLVIEDAQNQNQFVWVPVDGTKVTYKNWCTLGNVSYSSCSGATDTTTIDGVKYSAIPVDEEEQIKTYGGFYVARYEAGLATSTSEHSKELNNVYTEVPVSKAGSKIWNFIDYTHSYVAAQKMVSDTSIYGNNKSGLITGTQWDTIMKWYDKSGIKVDKTQDWGTYKNLDYSYSGTQVRSYFTYNGSSAGNWQEGAFSHTKTTDSISSSNLAHYHVSGLNSGGIKKNIADLGGNVWEWTSEDTSISSYRVSRGSAAYSSTMDRPASYRRSYTTSNALYYMGFRGVLYVAVDA